MENFIVYVLLAAAFVFTLDTIKSIPCRWDLSITEDERIKQDCGYICPDPWLNPDPYYCGPPSACCCAPQCNKEKAERLSFVGINWSDTYMQRPIPRTYQFQMLKSTGFRHIKLFSPSGLDDIVQTYKDDVVVHVGIPNSMISALAQNLNEARKFVRTELKPYQKIIKTILVGNEPLICIKTDQWLNNGECGAMQLPIKLLPAMKNLRVATRLESMSDVKITTPLNGGILTMSSNPWTPCLSDFRSPHKKILEQLWKFLRQDDAPFVVNLYTWFAAMDNAVSVAAGTGADHNQLAKDGKYEYYFNFDTQLDMLRVAMCKNGANDLDVWIGETGWPSGEHVKATLNNSHQFFKSILRRTKGQHLNDFAKDKIRFKGIPITVFLFEAFDEKMKYRIEYGNYFENTFGLFYENGEPKWKDSNGMLDLDIDDKEEKLSLAPEPLEPV